MAKISRQYVEMDPKLRKELNKALKKRAAQMSAKAGVEIKPVFASWLRDMVKQTIEAYR